MSLDRDTLKLAAVALLDSLADPHPLGHQESKARRYVLTAPGGTALELMFEQDPDSRPNLWMLAKAGALSGSYPPHRLFPAASLRTKRGKDGKLLYGRHSALERMPQLGDADLVCFIPTNLQELGAVLDRALAASAAGIKP